MRSATWILTFVVGALTVACDPIWRQHFTVRVPTSVQERFSAEQSGLVLFESEVVGRLCAPLDSAFDIEVTETDIGCAKEREIKVIAIRLSSEELGGLSPKELKLVSCGDTGPVDEGKTLDQIVGLLARREGWTDRAPVASSTATSFEGMDCEGANAEDVTLTLELTDVE